MKKSLFIIFTVLFMSLYNSANAMQIGYVDYAVLYEKIPQSAAIRKQIDKKLADMEKYIVDTKKLMDSKKTIEEKRKVRAPRLVEIEKMKKQYEELRAKQDAIVLNKTKEGSLAVIKAKKVDVILSKNNIIAGAKDVTLDVLKAIK